MSECLICLGAGTKCSRGRRLSRNAPFFMVPTLLTWWKIVALLIKSLSLTSDEKNTQAGYNFGNAQTLIAHRNFVFCRQLVFLKIYYVKTVFSTGQSVRPRAGRRWTAFSGPVRSFSKAALRPRPKTVSPAVPGSPPRNEMTGAPASFVHAKEHT